MASDNILTSHQFECQLVNLPPYKCVPFKEKVTLDHLLESFRWFPNLAKDGVSKIVLENVLVILQRLPVDKYESDVVALNLGCYLLKNTT